eukprot:Phypoly_transcript_12986.p1 GENE.Phypoly_transcript_12986~~Phypoly_transcript_12986.p1  ORF type:complete len:349 (-),score=29.18 Phypoly_transcript_12986:50-1063(-)
MNQQSLFSFLFFLALCLCGPILSQKTEQDDKFQQLARLAQSGPVIHIRNADQYHKLISAPNRNYSVFALFTATDSRYKCAPCVALAEEFRQFGVSYEAYFGGDYLRNKEFLEHPFFLAHLEPDTCMDIFQSYGFSTVPHMVHIPGGSKKVTKLRDDQFLRNPQTNINDIIAFVNKHTSIDIPIYQTLLEKLTPLITFVALTALVIRLIQKYQSYLYSTMLWYILAVFTYCIVMAGVVYNRIRNPPLMDIQQNGHMQLISPSPRTQYVAEGMIIAFVLGGAGVLFVVLGDFVPRLSGSKKRVAFWISAVLLFMFLTTLNNIYRMKYGSAAFRLNWRFF